MNIPITTWRSSLSHLELQLVVGIIMAVPLVNMQRHAERGTLAIHDDRLGNAAVAVAISVCGGGW